MNRVVAYGFGKLHELAKPCARIAPPILLCACSFSAMAAADPYVMLSTASAASPASDVPRAQLELSAKSLPRFDNIDASTRSSRVDMIWLPPRNAGLGLSLGITNLERPGLSTPDRSAGPSLDLGFHWRNSLDSQYRIDVTAWHRVTPTDALDLVQSRQPLYGARVEMQIGSAPKRGLVTDRGFVGLQLEGGARIMLRRSAGKPMLYYRTNF